MIEYRDASETVGLIKGPATTWTPPAKPYFVAGDPRGLFLEQFERDSLVWNNVELRRDHDPDAGVYSQTADGTLRLENTSSSLFLAGALDKTEPRTRQLISDIRAKKLTGLSVGFVADRDRWTKADDGRTELRVITRAFLNEISCVRTPANPGARIEEARHERQGTDGVEYRSVTLGYVARQMVPDASPGGSDDGDGDGWKSCDACDGAGTVPCSNCGGSGVVASEPDEDDDGAARAGKYTAQELEALGKAGKAFKHGNGAYAFPIADREDLSNAIRAVGGRARKSPAEDVRRFIMRRARQLGLESMIPDTWRPDGSVSASGSTVTRSFDELAFEFELLRAGPSRLARANRGKTERDRPERDWERSRQSRTSEYLRQQWTPQDRPR